MMSSPSRAFPLGNSRQAMKTRLRNRSVQSLFACALLSAPLAAHADALKLVNTLRTHECPRALGDRLSANRGLDAVAREVMRGYRIEEALKRADVRAVRTAVIHIKGDVGDASLKRMLIRNHCKTLTDARLSALGVARGNDEIALVLAAPFAPPSTRDARAVAREVLALVNEARAKSRSCGVRRFAAAPPVELNDKLNAASLAHAKDMAARGYISHEGSDKSAPADRVARAGYAWKAVGENVAAGQYTAKEVVDGWLSSPGHCGNIMDPDYTQMGVAYVSNPKQEIGIYWAQVLGRPR